MSGGQGRGGFNSQPYGANQGGAPSFGGSANYGAPGGYGNDQNAPYTPGVAAPSGYTPYGDQAPGAYGTAAPPGYAPTGDAGGYTRPPPSYGGGAPTMGLPTSGGVMNNPGFMSNATNAMTNYAPAGGTDPSTPRYLGPPSQVGAPVGFAGNSSSSPGTFSGPGNLAGSTSAPGYVPGVMGPALTSVNYQSGPSGLHSTIADPGLGGGGPGGQQPFARLNGGGLLGNGSPFGARGPQNNPAYLQARAQAQGAAANSAMANLPPGVQAAMANRGGSFMGGGASGGSPAYQTYLNSLRGTNFTPDSYADWQQNTTEGMADYQGQLESAYRAPGSRSFSAIPEAHRSQSDWAGAANELLQQVQNYAPHDGSSTINPNDPQYANLIAQYQRAAGQAGITPTTNFGNPTFYDPGDGSNRTPGSK